MGLGTVKVMGGAIGFDHSPPAHAGAPLPHDRAHLTWAYPCGFADFPIGGNIAWRNQRGDIKHMLCHILWFRHSYCYGLSLTAVPVAVTINMSLEVPIGEQSKAMPTTTPAPTS